MDSLDGNDVVSVQFFLRHRVPVFAQARSSNYIQVVRVFVL
jgi:hypothetical protein